MVYFFITVVVLVAGFLTILYLDYRRTTRKAFRAAPPSPAPAPLPFPVKVDRGLPPPGTPNRFAGFIYKRVKKVGNFFAYAWVKKGGKV
jgi:hypothetical protein